jgi:AcrR family transcriptional regulator
MSQTVPSARLPRADAVRNRGKVLAATRAVFAEHGVEAPVEEIARRAGVGVGTVYRHFPTKQDLLEALAIDYFTGVIAHAHAALAGDEEPGPAFFGVLQYCYEAQTRDRMFEVLNDVTASAAKAQVVDELCAVLDQLIDRARAAGAVRAELCADDVGVLMCGLAAAKRAEQWYHGEDPAGRYFTFVVDGLRPPVA